VKRLRIAQVAPVWLPVPPAQYGGTELIVHFLTEELVRRGHDVTLFAAGASRTRGRLRLIHEQAVVEMMQAGAAFEYDHYANANLATALAESESFDVIHSHLGFPQVPLGRLSRCPFLQTVHTTPMADDRWVLERHVDVPIAAISQTQVADLSVARRASVRIVPHGIDMDGFEPATEPGRTLVFLGRMSRQKSPIDAIRIARQAGVPLVLAGAPENAEEVAFFEAEVRPRIDGRQVQFVGRVNHARKNELLKGAVALVFPIQGDEAFGLAMVEAMACGTPVLGWNRASVPEIVEHGTTGFIGDSVEALAACVPQAAALDRRTVRARARERFHFTRMVDDYVAVYDALLSSCAPRR
jgi:glycosyltransferase involved in cell wall biosynthesis